MAHRGEAQKGNNRYGIIMGTAVVVALILGTYGILYDPNAVMEDPQTETTAPAVQAPSRNLRWTCIDLPRKEGAESDEITIIAPPTESGETPTCVRIRDGEYASRWRTNIKKCLYKDPVLKIETPLETILLKCDDDFWMQAEPYRFRSLIPGREIQVEITVYRR